MADRLERLINLVIALRETRVPMTAEDVHGRVAGYEQTDFDSFRRMFERDKADLRALGVPVERAKTDPWDDYSGYRIDPRRYDLPETSLEPSETAALAVALQATGLLDEAGAGLHKLAVDADDPVGGPTSGAGGTPAHTGAEDADNPAAPQPGPLAIDLDAPHRDELLAAQLTRTPVSFSYRALGREPEQRTVDPHALVHRRGRWYLVGRDHARDERRAFRLDRITGSVTYAGEAGSFSPPPGAGVDDVVPPPPSDAPETADVAAADTVAWQIARVARGAGRPDQRPDADGWTRYEVTVGDPEAFLTWALQFGPELEVCAPESLRARAVARLQAVAEGGAS